MDSEKGKKIARERWVIFGLVIVSLIILFTFYFFIDIYGRRSRADLDKFAAEADSLIFSDLEKDIIRENFDESPLYEGGVGGVMIGGEDDKVILGDFGVEMIHKRNDPESDVSYAIALSHNDGSYFATTPPLTLIYGITADSDWQGEAYDRYFSMIEMPSILNDYFECKEPIVTEGRKEVRCALVKTPESLVVPAGEYLVEGVKIGFSDELHNKCQQMKKDLGSLRFHAYVILEAEDKRVVGVDRRTKNNLDHSDFSFVCE